MTGDLDAIGGALAAADPVLGALIGAHGSADPFIWPEEDRTGDDRFAAMVMHILGQQISTVVARRLYDRVAELVDGAMLPTEVATLSVEQLRSAGLSRSKGDYIVGLARAIVAGDVDLDAVGALSDADAMVALTSIRGIGRWSGEMFLVHQLHRPDVLPVGDIGIRRAIQRAWQLDSLPDPKAVEELGRNWAPYRSYAAAVLWSSLAREHVIRPERHLSTETSNQRQAATSA